MYSMVQHPTNNATEPPYVLRLICLLDREADGFAAICIDGCKADAMLTALRKTGCAGLGLFENGDALRSADTGCFSGKYPLSWCEKIPLLTLTILQGGYLIAPYADATNGEFWRFGVALLGGVALFSTTHACAL